MIGIRRKKEKQDMLVKQVISVWENTHGEEVAEAYNKIVSILADLDVYTANMLVNLLWLQITQKTFDATVGKKEMGGEK